MLFILFWCGTPKEMNIELQNPQIEKERHLLNHLFGASINCRGCMYLSKSLKMLNVANLHPAVVQGR